MSMFDDVLGFGRSTVLESMTDEKFEPEVEETTLESVEMLDEGVEPMDFILQVAYENEMNMKNLDMAIMAEEYMYLRENNEEMVYEATKMESIVAKFKSGVTWLWNQIQKFFKTVMVKIDTIVKDDKPFLEKYAEKAKGKTVKIKAHPGLTDVGALVKDTNAFLEKIGKASKDIYTQCKAGNYTNSKSTEAALAFIGLAPVEGKNIKVQITEVICPKYNTKVEQKMAANAAIEVVSAYDDSKKTVKAVYEKNKIAINTHLTLAKALEKDAKSKDDTSAEKTKAIHTTIKVLNKYGSVLTLVNKTVVALLNTARSQSRAVIVAAATAADKEVKATGESASLIDTVDFGMTF